MDETNITTADLFGRTARLMGDAAMERFAATRVLLFGVGGVGSWCAEALIRSGIGHLTVVDLDCVDPSNINRQLQALVSTIGRPKVEVLRERLLDINPEADIVALRQRFSAETAPSFHLEEYDYVIDAIDSLQDKLELILLSTQKSLSPLTSHVSRHTFLSSMGAARKMDPTQLKVSEFWRIDGCPLAASLRKRMRRAKRFPERKFLCVWSPEVQRTSQTGGTLMPVTATFGLTLASLLLRDVMDEK